MIKEGVLENPAVEKIFGLHVSPELEVGTIGFHPGKFMASSDEIYLTVIGKGGHAAQVQTVINPLLIASEILLALKNISNPDIPVILSFGKIEGKGATNIIPETVEIAGTLRCFDETLRAQLQEQIVSICDSIAAKNGGSCQVNILKGYPVLLNNEKVTKQSMALASNYVGAANVLELPMRMGSEDFSYYTHRVPACFYRLGVGNKSKGITSGIHTSTFDIDEKALQISPGLMSWIAINS